MSSRISKIRDLAEECIDWLVLHTPGTRQMLEDLVESSGLSPTDRVRFYRRIGCPVQAKHYKRQMDIEGIQSLDADSEISKLLDGYRHVQELGLKTRAEELRGLIISNALKNHNYDLILGHEAELKMTHTEIDKIRQERLSYVMGGFMWNCIGGNDPTDYSIGQDYIQRVEDASQSMALQIIEDRARTEYDNLMESGSKLNDPPLAFLFAGLLAKRYGLSQPKIDAAAEKIMDYVGSPQSPEDSEINLRPWYCQAILHKAHTELGLSAERVVPHIKLIVRHLLLDIPPDGRQIDIAGDLMQSYGLSFEDCGTSPQQAYNTSMKQGNLSNALILREAFPGEIKAVESIRNLRLVCRVIYDRQQQ